MSGLMTFYKKSHHEQYKVCDDEVAERVGFEPRYREVQLISSFIKCVSGLVRIFYAETPKKSGVSGKLECVGKCAKIRIFGKNCGKNGKNNV